MSSDEAARVEDDQFVMNGVDALSGGPLWEPRSLEELAELALAEFTATPARQREELKSLSERKRDASFGMDVDRLDDPATARWGVIVPAAGGAELRKAIKPLLDQRATLLGAAPPVFEVGPDTTAVQFLRANGVERGLGVVAKVPYYLLILGSPEQISFRFQMELNSEYATGRLQFDTPDEYAAYAEHLVRYEQASLLPNSREAVFWAPERPIDPATSKSGPQLAQPLYAGLDPSLKFVGRLYRGDGAADGIKPATRDNLRAALGGPRPPALLFTASHGLGYRAPHPDQAAQQGALLSQEYIWGQPVGRDQWYGAEDLVRDGADVRGMVHFAFACYGAGTPRHDDYASPDGAARMIADQPFVAALPRQMLARGALAFIGHVDRAWGFSFLGAQASPPPGATTPLEAFQRALRRILRGDPIAYALRDAYDRGIHLSTSLLETIAAKSYGAEVAPVTLARLWVERNDARAYLVVGDPAARLRPHHFAQEGAPIVFPGVTISPLTARPAIEEPYAVSDQSQIAAPPAPATHDNHAGDVSFLPIQATGRDEQIDRELLVAWKDYLKSGFQQNNLMFRRVLTAFMVPYWLTVVMYGALFITGLGGFIAATLLFAQQQILFASLFGGMSVVAFLTFFISGPLRSLEQNLILITWLGIIYNTYWNQLMYTSDQKTIQADLETITRSALKDLDALVSRQGQLAAQRPGLREAAPTPTPEQ